MIICKKIIKYDIKIKLFSPARFQLGIIFIRLGNYKGAIEHLEVNLINLLINFLILKVC
jgi:hypothetical protein